jgi:hypothetical protein
VSNRHPAEADTRRCHRQNTLLLVRKSWWQPMESTPPKLTRSCRHRAIWDDRERRRIEKLSYQWECLKVLDPFDRETGHYAIVGWWRLPAEEAISDEGDLVYDTELCETYGVAFVVERGIWFTRDQWEERGHQLARVALHGPRTAPSLEEILHG